MSGKTECRGCLLWESGRADVLEDVQRHIEKIPPSDKAEPAAYDARLAVCAACAHLVGGTCLKCGCYPEFRAAFRRQHCPIHTW